MEERAKKEALLETRRLELEAAQSYFSSADACSEQDVVHLVSNLNAEIFQVVRTISDAFRATKRPTLDEKTRKTLKSLIGSSMMQCLLSFPHRNDTVVLEMALQFAMVAFIERAVSAWDMSIWKHGAFASVYDQMLGAECQTVTGRWRALARQHAPERERWKGIIENDLSYFSTSILLAAGGNGSIPQSVKESLVVIACMASQLRKMIGEDIVGSNYQVTVGRPGDEFSPNAMEDSCAVKGKPPKTGVRVFCPSELGLRRIEKGDSGAADIRAVTLVRSKVILEDFADELGLREILRCADKK
ncbi:uncharacterized protein LAESUDRAFT_760336 [Laetiporus sulphureus 93-53]|uniref:Uncharacterized protein n=1 Tax=Laetiporus sulphureus 93-53 TaxID=1314785 RepID=A0A165DRE5_9APHY|nr:uncharacterized protein LAESUDRAFT_760336 [Laetiporus sulphureus 93-53]KZT05468.1 hypothetical protein LAESUDRAFT_760336 [Laetiporus sulphureus 93-53]